MPTRTINLKMVLGKKESSLDLRHALWTTHEEINAAVRRIEEMLLLCRGEEYRTKLRKGDGNETEITVSRDEVRRDALTMAREAQRKNGKEGVGNDEEVLAALRMLYEAMVPSCNLDEKGKVVDGDAQACNDLVSPLMDKESKGGMSAFEKARIPVWLEKKQRKEDGWKDDADEWIKSEEGITLLNISGRPPAWKSKYQKGEEWYDAYEKSVEDNRKKTASGKSAIILRLRELALLPLFEPPVYSRLPHKDGQGVSPWDRRALRLAVEHLLSWETWNHRTRKEYAELKQRRDDLGEQYAKYSNLFRELREYEKERHQQLKEIAFFDDETPFTVKARTIRGWPRVREAWLKNGHTAAERKKILADLQTKLRGAFGDPDFFLWLAADGREHLWRETDVIPAFAALNVANETIKRHREYSLMTFADARFHPRWCMYEAPGGSNLRNYEIWADADGKLVLRLVLLERKDDAMLQERAFDIPLAPSGQLQNLSVSVINKKKKTVSFSYRSAHQDFQGTLRGAEILFDRSFLERESRVASLKDYPGPVWLKLTLDVNYKGPDEWLDGRGKVQTPSAVWHFNSGLANKTDREKDLMPGLRVLSVDMGLRTFAACSVFELVKGKPDKGLFFSAADGRAEDDPEKLWAKHERSFRLTLPGENVSREAERARQEAMDKVRELKNDLRLLKELLRLGQIESAQEREERLEAFFAEWSLLSAGEKVFLKNKSSLPSDQWKELCLTHHRMVEKKVGEKISKWRRETAPHADSWADHKERRSYDAGKSVWAIEYLEAVRKLLVGWGMHGREYGQVNRLNKKEFGTYARHLLEHINNLKDDRVKAGSDLIIQAARGYVPLLVNGKQKGWEKKYEPCRVILFEDLARYRFRVDRPRRENSQLMKWNHREILKETKMQAEIYGITVTETSAGFSSRFHAKTGAPGIRCRHLGESDFENGKPKQHVTRELGHLFDVSQLRPGMIVPWNGGELFATVIDDKKQILHADINAAQNLQRRFWTRNGDAYRVTARISGDTWTIESKGSRINGALAVALGEDPTKPHIFSFAGVSDDAQLIIGKGKAKKSKEEEDVSGEDIFEEALAEVEGFEEKGKETFFRDPSGKILPSSKWFGGKKFWGVVKQRVARSLCPTIFMTVPPNEVDFDDDLPA